MKKILVIFNILALINLQTLLHGANYDQRTAQSPHEDLAGVNTREQTSVSDINLDNQAKLFDFYKKNMDNFGDSKKKLSYLIAELFLQFEILSHFELNYVEPCSKYIGQKSHYNISSKDYKKLIVAIASLKENLEKNCHQQDLRINIGQEKFATRFYFLFQEKNIEAVRRILHDVAFYEQIFAHVNITLSSVLGYTWPDFPRSPSLDLLTGILRCVMTLYQASATKIRKSRIWGIYIEDINAELDRIDNIDRITTHVLSHLN